MVHTHKSKLIAWPVLVNYPANYPDCSPNQNPSLKQCHPQRCDIPSWQQYNNVL